MSAAKLTPALALALGLIAAAPSAQAQYKIVAPDGRVTYTDRPPADGSLKITELGRNAPPPAAPAGPALPAELRRLTERFPVTLFAAPDCAPCDTGRSYLRERGIPYTERQVVSNDDAAALERLVAGRTLPALTVGGQALRGFASADWASYLDAAGYPRESRLPSGWAPPPPTPLVARAPAPARTVPAPEAPRQAADLPASPPGNTIRF